jgi:hypothetical protein
LRGIINVYILSNLNNFNLLLTYIFSTTTTNNRNHNNYKYKCNDWTNNSTYYINRSSLSRILRIILFNHDFIIIVIIVI